MKTNSFKSFLLVLLAATLPQLASAYRFKVGGIYYSINSDGTSVTVTYDTYSNNSSAYSNLSGALNIPKSVIYERKTYSVTAIGDHAFYRCTGLTSVTMPNSVTTIGEESFYNCTGLTSVTIPNSVTKIGKKTFYNCTGLTSVNIPNSVTLIGDYAFHNCTGLTSVTIPNSVTYLSGFSGCTGLISVTIPNSVISIGSSAFSGCIGLTSVTIPNSVTSIGSSAFSRCTGLTEVTIPNSVTSIGSSAFSGSTGLTSVTIPTSVTSIGSSAFSGCTGLASVTIPNSVTTIGSSAFSDCTGLTEVTIGSSVTSIGSSAFKGCERLSLINSEIENPSIVSIYDTSFPSKYIVESTNKYIIILSVPNGTSSIYRQTTPWNKFKIVIENQNLIKGDNFYYIQNDDGNSVSVAGRKNLETSDIVIPCSITHEGKTYNVTSISSNAFYDSNINSVTIPNSVTVIGNEAFYHCSSLTTVSIPNSVTSIGDYAFCISTGLTSVTLGNSVTSIGYKAFSGCTGLTSVNIPSSVTSIGTQAFYHCSHLTSVNINSLAAWCNIHFADGTSNPLYYAHDLYLNGNKITDLAIPNSVTAIKNYTFSHCSGLTSVTIGNSVTTIGEYAFTECTGLTSVNIPSSVTSIGTQAFYYCSHLTSVNINSLAAWCNIHFADGTTNPLYYAHDLYLNGNKITDLAIPNSVTAIKNYTFSHCSGLTSVDIPSSVTSIGSGAFFGCSGLTSVTIPNSVTSIGGSAFSGCTGLTSVTIPNSVTSIGGSAFSGCTGLTSVTIPNSVTSIGGSAFYNCTGLTSVTFTGNGALNTNNNMPTISQLKTVNIGSGITSLGNFGFTPDIVSCYAAVPPTCQSSTFSNYDGELHVPSTSTASYFTANYWQNFSNFNNDLTEKVTLNQTEVSLQQWETTALSANTNPSGGNVLWSTNNPAIATVSDDGVVTAISGGECDIFATLESNPAVYASCHVNASYPEITISLNYNEVEMKLGSDTILVATITPNNTGLTPTWTSSNTSVATVANGVVTAVGQGECYITAAVLNKTATCHIIVDEVTISLNYTELEMKYGADTTLVATIDPDNAGLIPIWSSSNTSVAIVENGVVTAVGQGECDITAAVLDKTATCHIIVDDVRISLNVNEIYLRFTEDTTLVATIDPDNADLIPTWASSDENVATVENGVVTAISGGECDIIATVLDKSASCHIIVNGNVLITLNKEQAIIGANQLLTVYPDCYPDVPVELIVTSSDPSVAVARVVNAPMLPASWLMSFSENGMALAYAEGIAESFGIKAPALVGTKAIMIVGVQHGTATITVTTADGKADAAILELRVVDVNGDGNITASDVTEIYNYLLNGDMTYYDTSDITGDGVITASDVTAIYNLLLDN